MHDQCRVPQSWINKTAVELCNDRNRAEIVEGMDNSLSGAKGDPWIRFGSRQVESEAFKFVAEAAQRDSILAQLASMPARSSWTQPTQRQAVTKGSGCATMLLSIAVAIAFSLASIVAILF
jgi:hypothetical protein